MLRTQIYLSEEQIKNLRKLAYLNKTTVSQVIRELIGEKIKAKKAKKTTKKTQNTGQWLLSLADEAERLGFKGPADLATNVDEYLYGGKK